MVVEKRNSNRVDVDWPARVLHRGHGMAAARLRNVSIGGAYFECGRLFPSGTKVLMEIGATHEIGDRKLLIEGQIMHTRLSNTPGLHGHGAKLERIRDEDLWYLLAIVADLWERSEEQGMVRARPKTTAD